MVNLEALRRLPKRSGQSPNKLDMRHSGGIAWKLHGNGESRTLSGERQGDVTR